MAKKTDYVLFEKTSLKHNEEEEGGPGDCTYCNKPLDSWGLAYRAYDSDETCSEDMLHTSCLKKWAKRLLKDRQRALEYAERLNKAVDIEFAKPTASKVLSKHKSERK